MPRTKPYWRAIERGLHLGYRRLGKDKAGPWIARRYKGNQQYEEEGIGIADDISDADGVTIFDYWQAVNVARGKSSKAVAAGPYTVADAVRDYLTFLTRERKERLRREVPNGGPCATWLADLANKPARLRSPHNGVQRYRDASDDENVVRGRRASANQCLLSLKAALNLAFSRSKVTGVTSKEAWHRVRPFRGVDVARVRYLTIAESQRLLNACEPDFRNLVRAALETGARYSELARLKVEDYNPDVGTVAIYVSKTSKPRHVVLTDDGNAFFHQLCAGRSGSSIMLVHDDGRSWGPAHQQRPMELACERARIDPPIGFHALRHTWASLSVMAGMPLMVVARNLGHVDTKMVEKHYGHLAPSYIADAIRKHAPRFGTAGTANVKSIR